MVKFKIAFTIKAQTLFALISRTLPDLEDLLVEEIIEKPQTIEEKFLGSAPVKVMNKPKSKHAKFNLNIGLNKIIVQILSDNKVHHTNDFIELVSKTEYSINSIGSRLASLEEYGVVKNAGKGKWELTEKYRMKITHSTSV
jgi:predicted methyltransferase